MSTGLIPPSTAPSRLDPFSKSKCRSSWKWKYSDVKTQQKCHDFEIVPNSPRSSGHNILDDQQWSLDLEVSAEDKPVTQNIVLESTETIADALDFSSAFIKRSPLNIHKIAPSSTVSTTALHKAPSGNLLSHGHHEELPVLQNTLPSGPEIVLNQSLPSSALQRHPPHLPTSAEPSINSPPSPPPLPPVERAQFRCYRCENVFKIQKELARRRTGLLTARTHLENEQTMLAGLRDYDSKSRELVIKAMVAALERSSFGHDLTQITELQSKSITANNDLKDGEARFSKAQSQLSSIEYHFGKKETELYGLLSQSHMHVGSLQSDALGSALQGTESVTETESASLPSLLEEYYDRAGDANLAWDRLQELETDHQIELRQRERAVEENLPVVPSGAEFVRGFVEERTRIVRDLIQAKTDAQGLRRQCEEREYSIKDDGSNKALQAYNLDLWADESDRHLQLLLVGEVDRDERVKDWVKGDVHGPDSSTTSIRHRLWEIRKAYSETGTPAPLHDAIVQSQSEAGYERKTRFEIFDNAPEAPIMKKDMVEYPQTWLDLTQVEAGLSGASTACVATWRPEVSLHRRCSSPEI